MIDFAPLEKKLKIKFKKKDLLIQAFIHRSFLNESKQKNSLRRNLSARWPFLLRRYEKKIKVQKSKLQTPNSKLHFLTVLRLPLIAKSILSS